MNNLDISFRIAYLNCRGQTGFTVSKQLQVENFIKTYDVDILHLQECHIETDTFSSCRLINSSFTIIHNNSSSKYGTASLVKSTLPVEDVILHHSGRIILFNIGTATFGNVYLPSGTDAATRASRESLLGETIPNLLINSQTHGILGGDWNCITSKDDCTSFPEAKMSPCLKRLINTFNWKDTFRILQPLTQHFSHYYNIGAKAGATRIDRSYSFGEVSPTQSSYVSVAFSDHLAHIVNINLPSPISVMICPKSRPFYKIRPEIVRDEVFQDRLSSSMKEWQEVKSYGVPILIWWEVLVKPGIRKLALERGKEISKARRSFLNLLMMKQSFLTRKVHSGETRWLTALKEVQLRIEKWFDEELEKVKYQSKVDDIQCSEKVRIYHHEIHQKNIKKSAILKLSTPGGIIEGHNACSNYLQDILANLLEKPAELDLQSQDNLLSGVTASFTDKDNEMLTAIPTKVEVEESLKTSNLHAAPGNGG